MFITRVRSAVITAGAVIGLITCGCSGGGSGSSSSAPRPGTIGHAWLTAGESYKKGDHAKAMEYLSRVASNQNEYRDKARVWLMVVSAGVAEGNIELANAYEMGSKLNKGMSSDYRKRMFDSRNVANTATLQFAEAAHEFIEQNKDAKVVLDFPFPAGSAAEPVQLAKINKGFNIQEADNAAASQAVAQRGVVKTAAALAGSPDDPSKAAASFQNPPHDAFYMALADALYRKADLYSNRKLDMPKRGNVLCKVALEALALVPESKDKKALETKIKDEMKKHKIIS
jgi:hypothetical protein